MIIHIRTTIMYNDNNNNNNNNDNHNNNNNNSAGAPSVLRGAVEAGGP